MSSSNSPIDGAEQAMEQILQAQAHIWNHCYGFISSFCIKCAVELGIPDAIHCHGGPMTLNQLVEAIPVRSGKAHGLYRVMRVLVRSGFFELQISKREGASQEEEAYALNSVSKLLLRDNPVNMESYLRLMLHPISINLVDCLSTWFQNDHLCSTETVLGMAPWEVVAGNPVFGAIFNSTMESDSRLTSRVLINRCKWLFEGLKSIVDIGGGTGEMGKAITEAFPHMQYTVFDLPQLVANLQGTSNLRYVGGDIFNDKFPPADAILLKLVLHDYTDEKSVKILKKCKEAIPRKEDGGRLIIIDMVMDKPNPSAGDEKVEETQLLVDIAMMTVGGIERNREEWSKLFEDAGFSSYKISPVLGLRSVIEVYP